MSEPADNSGALLEGALGELDRLGVAYTWRKDSWDGSSPPPREVDLGLERRDLERAEGSLRRSGFEALKVRGHGRHRFYLAEVEGRWLKLDVKVEQEDGLPRFQRLRRRIPLAARRQGPVVAILGPDGAGKGTIIEQLRAEIPVHVSVVYLGYRRRARRNRATQAANPRTALGPAYVLKGFARAVRLLLPAYARAWCGAIVLCDRHPVEALAVPPVRGRTAAALERFLIRRGLPQPDAIVLLDAPGEILFSRKGEHSAETLERWRQAYREAFRGDDVTVVSTVDSLGAAVSHASHAVWSALAARRGWSSR